jgi:hypothetical protein
MKNFRMIIVGGGTAGWFCAAWFSKMMPNIDVTLIESALIPKIGVGESVTPHVSAFFNKLGFNDRHWMQHTGSIHKYANKFINWTRGEGESEHFSFSYPTDIDVLLRDVHYPLSLEDLKFNTDSIRTTDTFMNLLSTNEIDKFDKYFNSQFHYMDKNVSPYSDNKNYLLNPLFSWSHHINADKAADYARDFIAIPNGVTHIQEKIKDAVIENGNVKKVLLDSDREVSGDLFVDASGFNKILIKKLGWDIKVYNDHPVDSAWVCQYDYTNPKEEMVNYTQSIAQDHGWLFKIGLYHRMGSGYCFSSSEISDEVAEEDFVRMINNRRMEPRKIKWTPSRLKNAANGNTVALGLSSAFVEPMEANALYIITTGIKKLHAVLETYFQTNTLCFDEYNSHMAYCVDDIADFILIHYTLSPRNKNSFWKRMNDLGRKENHVDLVYEKYMNRNNSMAMAMEGRSMFPDYMWAQLAHSWGVDISKWNFDQILPLHLKLSKMHFTHLEAKHRMISETRENSFEWMKSNIFGNLSPAEWEREYLIKRS